jgi:RNA polymerase sigma-70 factor (ECF subfamily)
MQKQIEVIYRHESRRVFATLVRLLRDFDLAEDALQEAFTAAMQQWPQDGLPHNPRAWLVSAARFKAIDRLRREARIDSLEDLEQEPVAPPEKEQEAIVDDQLRLIFTCCHPALAAELQIALTLREICGLTTEAIASAFLVTPTTMAQRLVRGKAKIRNAGIPYEVPGQRHLGERLKAVLTVIYLVFNEGYHASSGDSLDRPDLTQEAIRLGRLLLELLPHAEVRGLLALMLLHHSRRATRTAPDGDLLLLEEQDRSLWDRALIREGQELLESALITRQFGAFSVQAAIAAVHAEAPTADATDWPQIVALYDVLLRLTPSSIVELNRAVAVAMRDGPETGLTLVDNLLERGDLRQYHLAHAAKADLHRRLRQYPEAHKSYKEALQLAQQQVEKRFLQKRLDEIKANLSSR